MGKLLTRIETEFVFKNVMDTKQQVILKSGKFECRSVLVDMSASTLTFSELTASVPLLVPGASFEIYFLFRNTRLKAESSLVSHTNSTITLSNPSGLEKHRSRQFKRIPARTDWKITCILQGEQIELDFPKAAYAEPEGNIQVSSQFDATKVADLIKAFREKVKQQSNETKIVMFRERKPEAFEELLLAKTGLMLYLPSSQDGYPDLQLFADKRIITNDMILQTALSLKKSPDDARSLVDKLIPSKKAWGILSEVYCPILFQEYVVGYIYLMSSKTSGKIITPGLVSFVQRFSQILSHALNANGYFKSGKTEQPYNGASLVDISASGLLLSVPDKRLAQKLVLFSEMDLVLSIDRHDLRLKADIMREYRDENTSYFGIQYKDMTPEQSGRLAEMIYQSQNPSTHEA